MDFIGICQFACTILNTYPVHRDFLFVVCGLHQFFLKENVTIDEGKFLVYIPFCVHHRETKVIEQSVLDEQLTCFFIPTCICCFCIEYNTIVSSSVNSLFHLIKSFRLVISLTSDIIIPHSQRIASVF